MKETESLIRLVFFWFFYSRWWISLEIIVLLFLGGNEKIKDKVRGLRKKYDFDGGMEEAWFIKYCLPQYLL